MSLYGFFVAVFFKVFFSGFALYLSLFFIIICLAFTVLRWRLALSYFSFD